MKEEAECDGSRIDDDGKVHACFATCCGEIKTGFVLSSRMYCTSSASQSKSWDKNLFTLFRSGSNKLLGELLKSPW